MSAAVQEESRAIRQLRAAGAAGSEVRELLAYNANPFDLEIFKRPLDLPLRDEPFVDAWRLWCRDAARRGAAATLRERLTELHFPIREGVSHWPSYRQATRRGVDPRGMSQATGVELERPDSISLRVEESLAGAVPVIVVRDRPTFEALVRALSRSNEPATVPEALGGLMITNYRNWWRLRRLYGRSDSALAAAGRRERSTDRFMLLSDGPYSAVPAAELGLEDAAWRRRSLELRQAHEQVHYLMRRLLGVMRNNLLDELIADYLGMRLAWGAFRPDWFLRCLGLDGRGRYGPGGRLDLYRGDPALSPGAFEALQRLIWRATRSLEDFDRSLGPEAWNTRRTAAILGALASSRLETLAAEGGGEALRAALKELELRLERSPEPPEAPVQAP
ncbi:MAG: hypothetical protein AAF725_08410 [Acidobacteriota bacterium]